LRRLLGGREAEAAKAAGLLWRAAEDLDFAGRVLSAANAELPVSGEPLTRLWQATTLLREHRGDGHFAALAVVGIDGCEAVVFGARKTSRAISCSPPAAGPTSSGAPRPPG
jgi:Helix-turn-helix family